ncbi:hypothetical protein PoB_001748900 [Plakobranchus ocellatus]|uniref:Uncharacterized protein n=1 Tax=Plakobranchus ocellatus TaxID=259542 RepID=A0AAV3ZAM8_9GAST|nr:hypothetical protein PoB_001748900 [Plakobranchus ocellatus]
MVGAHSTCLQSRSTLRKSKRRDILTMRRGRGCAWMRSRAVRKRWLRMSRRMSKILAVSTMVEPNFVVVHPLKSYLGLLGSHQTRKMAESLSSNLRQKGTCRSMVEIASATSVASATNAHNPITKLTPKTLL